MDYIRRLLHYHNCRLISSGREGFFYETPTRNKVFMDYDRIEQKDYDEDDFI